MSYLVDLNKLLQYTNIMRHYTPDELNPELSEQTVKIVAAENIYGEVQEDITLQASAFAFLYHLTEDEQRSSLQELAWPDGSDGFPPIKGTGTCQIDATLAGVDSPGTFEVYRLLEMGIDSNNYYGIPKLYIQIQDKTSQEYTIKYSAISENELPSNVVQWTRYADTNYYFPIVIYTQRTLLDVLDNLHYYGV